VRSAVDIFGYERIMFGSNLPVSTLSATFDTIVQTILAAVHDASTAQLNRLFSVNARKFYRIHKSD
jgi:predicted TIM-barrel fold metal-dependent hydrolase